MRIKCPHCNGKGFSELNSALNMTCGWCMGKGELDLEIVPTEPQTEQEYLQTCTTEQLAETILEMCDYRPCFACGIGYCDDEDWCHVYSDEAREFVLEWLKQPHKE